MNALHQKPPPKAQPPLETLEKPSVNNLSSHKHGIFYNEL